MASQGPGCTSAARKLGGSRLDASEHPAMISRSRAGGSAQSFWCGRRLVKAIDEAVVSRHELMRKVLAFLRVLLDEGDGFAVVIGRFAVFAPGFADHAEPIVAVVLLGVTHKQLLGGAFRRIDIPCADHVDDGVGVFRQSLVAIVILGVDEASDTAWAGLWRWWCGGAGRRFVFGEAALLVFLATAAGTGIISSDLGHLNNFSLKDDPFVPRSAEGC